MGYLVDKQTDAGPIAVDDQVALPPYGGAFELVDAIQTLVVAHNNISDVVAGLDGELAIQWGR